MISVALCTYNGALFIQEQIQSILEQSLKVDEIVVCDDGSKDATVDLVESLREDLAQMDIELLVFVNEKSLGVKRNFRRTIEACHGDIIFLADQDDVWMPNKVETIVNWFKEKPNKDVVFTDAALVDENRTALNKTQWNAVGFYPHQQDMFKNGHGLEVFMMANRATGATMAFRREAVQLRDEDWGHVLHDEYIAVKALLKGKLGFIAEPLIEYRQHSGQQVGSGINEPWADSVYSKWNFYNPVKSLKHMEGWKFDETKELKNHRCLLVERELYRKKCNGVFQILCNIQKYKLLYGQYWMLYVKMDFRKALGTLYHTILR